MLKKTIFTLFVLSLFAPLSSQANWGWAAGGAVGFNNGFYNPALAAGYGAPLGGFNTFWGGGYNLNSLMGNGGWGGYPAGHGFGPINPAGFGGGGSGCGGGGALTGGFGGFYSPFVGGY